MSVALDISQFSPRDAEIEVMQLMEHIASGKPSVWAVYASNGFSEQFDRYDEASRHFDTLPADLHPALVLYTRVGTAVRFRYKEPVVEDSI